MTMRGTRKQTRMRRLATLASGAAIATMALSAVTAAGAGAAQAAPAPRVAQPHALVYPLQPGCVFGNACPPASVNMPQAPITATEEEMANEIVVDINAERASRGLAPVIVDPVLRNAMQYVDDWYAQQGQHDDIGLPASAHTSYYAGSESAGGSEASSAGGSVQAWVDSPAHSLTVFNQDGSAPVYAAVGVGCNPTTGTDIETIDTFETAPMTVAAPPYYPSDTTPVVGNGGTTCFSGVDKIQGDPAVSPYDSNLGTGCQYSCIGTNGQIEVTQPYPTGGPTIPTAPCPNCYGSSQLVPTPFDLTPQAGDPPYQMVAADGGIFSFGTSTFHGSTGALHLNSPIVGMASTPSGGGYWLVAADGGIFAFGDARFYGSTGGLHLNSPIVGMAATPDGGGYWLASSGGEVFAFGDAHNYGSTGALNKPIVGMAATPDGGGYWLVASDGGIFAFGDAHFYGSTGALTLNKPIVGMASTPDGGGYWLVASDGGIFAFGDAHFYGSTGALTLNQPIVGMLPTAGGGGYWLVASDGGIFAFGDAKFAGSMGGVVLNQPIVGMGV